MEATEPIQAAYKEAQRSYWVVPSKIGCGIALVLVPAGVTLDYFVYPDHFVLFFLLRLGCDVVLGAIFILHFTRYGQRNVPVLTFSWLMSVQVMICYMIFLSDGYRSTYYAGLNLAMLGVGILLPTSALDATLFCVATVALYYFTCIIDSRSRIDFSVLYNNLYFLILTGTISVTAVYFNARRRFSEFRLSFELDERNKELAELDRLKSEFFANISHELRTPLTLIIAPLQDILQGSDRLPDRIAGPLRIVRDNALRLLKLVNDLLDVIRLEEGKIQLERDIVKLNSLLTGIVDAMSHLAEAREVHLAIEVPKQAVHVLGDRHAFEKIFFNLLSNALKFTPAGGTISVRCGTENGIVRVEVADTGIGISKADLPHVFDRFRQADSSTTRRYQGTGLGLALVKELTERQEGTVGAMSESGVGTTMIVNFPLEQARSESVVDEAAPAKEDPLERMYLAAEQVAALPLSVPDLEQEETVGSGSTHGSVLVVDDEPDMRRYLVETLSKEYAVTQAADGRTGLELARRTRPDLMVLDMMLPEMDGLDVCAAIKGDAETRGIKLILLTARADEATKLAALERGADDFLTKPFSSTEVKTRLRNLLQAAHLERDLQQRNAALEQALEDLRRTEGQLIHSEKLNALGSLAAGLLHEINNPLNYALTALQIAKTDPAITGDEDLADIFSDIDDGMQRIRNIVTDLRSFAYPSKDEQQPFEFEEALQSALQFTAHEMRGIAVRRALDENGLVQGSRSHIVQVLVNLFTNAAKALTAVDQDQGRTGEIQVVSESRDGRLYVRVRDNGVGMSADVLARIFDPFYTTRDVGEGMGLGLSICHTIIKNHGGTLSAQSEPGQWTEFSFDLPLAEASPP